jgi:transposase
MSKIRFVGLDVHAETIAVAVAEADGEVRQYGTIPNQMEAIRRMVKKLGPAEDLRACYEAGVTGYTLFWQLTALGAPCEVIAPSLAPCKPGDRVKNDRRDAERLARSHRAGELTAVWVPGAEHEALRDLVRAREDAKQDQLRARQRLSHFLLRHGQRPPVAMTRWSKAHWEWIQREAHFSQGALEATLRDYVREVRHATERIGQLEKDLADAVEAGPAAVRAVVEALQALRGVAFLTAVTIVAELGILTRFASPRQLMGYSGLVASEHSSGSRIVRGGITKTGNGHLRRIVVEAAWAYQHRPWVSKELARRQKGLDAEIVEISWKAQRRLHTRYLKLLARGKSKPQAVTALARELLGFLWAIAVKIEGKFTEDLTVAA